MTDQSFRNGVAFAHAIVLDHCILPLSSRIGHLLLSLTTMRIFYYAYNRRRRTLTSTSMCATQSHGLWSKDLLIGESVEPFGCVNHSLTRRRISRGLADGYQAIIVPLRSEGDAEDCTYAGILITCKIEHTYKYMRMPIVTPIPEEVYLIRYSLYPSRYSARRPAAKFM